MARTGRAAAEIASLVSYLVKSCGGDRTFLEKQLDGWAWARSRTARRRSGSATVFRDADGSRRFRGRKEVAAFLGLDVVAQAAAVLADAPADDRRAAQQQLSFSWAASHACARARALLLSLESELARVLFSALTRAVSRSALATQMRLLQQRELRTTIIDASPRPPCPGSRAAPRPRGAFRGDAAALVARAPRPLADLLAERADVAEPRRDALDGLSQRSMAGVLRSRPLRTSRRRRRGPRPRATSPRAPSAGSAPRARARGACSTRARPGARAARGAPRRAALPSAAPRAQPPPRRAAAAARRPDSTCRSPTATPTRPRRSGGARRRELRRRAARARRRRRRRRSR